MANIINNITLTTSSTTTTNGLYQTTAGIWTNTPCGIGTYTVVAGTNTINNNPISFNVDSDQITHENEKLNLYFKAVVILLNQKGILITENEIKEVIDSIKVMNKLTEE